MTLSFRLKECCKPGHYLPSWLDMVVTSYDNGVAFIIRNGIFFPLFMEPLGEYSFKLWSRKGDGTDEGFLCDSFAERVSWCGDQCGRPHPEEEKVSFEFFITSANLSVGNHTFFFAFFFFYTLSGPSLVWWEDSTTLLSGGVFRFLFFRARFFL